MNIEQPRPLKTETPVLAAKRVLVAAPRTPHGRKAAETVHRALQGLGADPQLLADPPGDMLTKADGPVVVVGNLADSRCVRELYFHFLCATDLCYPGPGGYELRTLCNPFGTGNNVILIGYSDGRGAKAGTDEFLARLKDPIPHLAVVKATRLPVLEKGEVAKTKQGVGYLYYLTGDPKLGARYRKSLNASVKNGQVISHLQGLSTFLVWRLVEDMALFTEQERLATTRFLYESFESREGLHHVLKCPRVLSTHVPGQNHELIPAAGLAYAADYFGTHFPDLPGPEKWREAAKLAFAPYGESFKPLCDGLCHGWWMSQPVMLAYALLDPEHRYFEGGGARNAADYAMAVVNNDGWLPSAGDADLRRQFPGPSLRVAAAYYNDGRYRFVHELAPRERRFAWLNCTVPIRAFDTGIEPQLPQDMTGVTVVPVDPLVYHVWERQPDLAGQVVRTAPSAPIERCFDKLAVRTGWKLQGDYLLIDGLGGGSHSYDDAGGILDYARLGLSLIVSEDSFVYSAPEHHSTVTIVRDGESGSIPGFAILEANETDSEGNVYVRLRQKDYAGADWVREVHLMPGKCLVVNDTVIAKQAGDFAVEARFRAPARFVLDGRQARCRRKSPCVGDVDFRIESLCDASQLTVQEVPVHIRYQSEQDRQRWKTRYHTDEVVLTTLVARAAGRLEAGEFVRLTHLAQACAPGEAQVHLSTTDQGIRLSDGKAPQALKTFRLGQTAKMRLSASDSPQGPAPVEVFQGKSRITALCPLAEGSIAIGTEKGEVNVLDRWGRPAWSADLVGPVHDIGVARGKRVMWVVGHGPKNLTAFDDHGRVLWTTEIERVPCPWPWWELPTPAPVQVAGGVDATGPFFAVGCGDLQVRCFSEDGKERWRWRYNEGVPGRISVADVDGSGKPSIVGGGDILTDTSACRVLDPAGRQRIQFPVEGWTSRMTALAFGNANRRRFIAFGANRGKNLHLYELAQNLQAKWKLAWKRHWCKLLGGEVVGVEIFGLQDRLIAGTTQGFLLCYDLTGKLVWSKLLARPIRNLASLKRNTLVGDDSGEFRIVSLSGEVRRSFRMPGPCSILTKNEGAVYLVCGRLLARL